MHDRLILDVAGRVYFVDPREIESAQADGNYVSISTGRESYRVRCQITELQGRLDATKFLRIHRSVIINTGRIAAMQRGVNGEYSVRMVSGREFSSGRTFRQRIQGTMLRSRGSRMSAPA